MLVRKTPWLIYSETDRVYLYKRDTNFWFIYLRMCESGIREVFKLPRASWIRLLIHDRPSKNRVRFEITTKGYSSYAVTVDNDGCSLYVNITNFLSQEIIKRLMDKQKYYYAECEYI